MPAVQFALNDGRTTAVPIYLSLTLLTFDNKDFGSFINALHHIYSDLETPGNFIVCVVIQLKHEYSSAALGPTVANVGSEVVILIIITNPIRVAQMRF